MPEQARSHHRIRLVTSTVVLGFLVLAHTILICLWGTHALDRHLFPISRVGEASQIINIGAQATITFLLVVLSYSVQAVAADQIIRQRQTVAALQDNLDSWKGFTASLVALWRGRRLGPSLRTRVLLVAAFFAAGSILQITTPSVITVNMANTTMPAALEVTTMPGDMINLNFSDLTWTTDTTSTTIIGSLPLIWNQSASSVGAPAGVNGSVFFSTLETAQNETLVFQDPFARQVTVGCASIPRHSADTYTASYSGPKSSDSGTTQLRFVIKPVVSPEDGVDLTFLAGPYWEVDYGAFQLGGKKPAEDSPPTFHFSDVVEVVTLAEEPAQNPDYGIASFVFMSQRSDALPANSSLGIEPPIPITFEAAVRSWVQSGNLTEAEAKNHSWLENGTFTVYAWPIGCSIYVQDITAEVLGNNRLLRTTSSPIPIGTSDIFTRPASTDVLEIAWEPLIAAVYWAEYEDGSSSSSSSKGEILPADWLQDLILPSLSGNNSSLADRISAVEDVLERFTALAYGLIIQSFRSQTHDGIPEVAASWLPANRDTLGEQSIVRGKFTINGLQLIIGAVCVAVLVLSSLCAMALSTDKTEEARTSLIRDGGVVDLISLMNGSSVPGILADGSLMNTSEEKRREVAERTFVVFGYDRLDTPQRIHNRLLTLPPFPHQDSKFDSVEVISKSIRESSFYSSSLPDKRPWMSTLKPHYLASQLVLLSLLAFNVVFVILWAEDVFDHRLWPAESMGTISQVTSTLAQVWSVGPLLVLGYTVQTIASDKSVRKRQTVAQLHDSLSAWGGLGPALGAVWRSVRYTHHVSFDIVLVSFFFSAVALLHITMPSVVSVDSVSHPIPIWADAPLMPGHILNIGAYGEGPALVADALSDALTTVPYMYGQRNMSSIGRPPGLNDTAFFSAPFDSLGSGVVLNDANASLMAVHCGVVPRSKKYDGAGLAVNWTQPKNASTWTQSHLSFSLPFGFDISETVGWQVNAAMDKLSGEEGDYIFGGPKSSKDAPPTVKFNDALAWGVVTENGTAWDVGSIALLYISLHNDTLRLNSSVDFAPPITYTTDITNWAWVEDSSLSIKQQQETAFLETASVTFYVYPLACSMYATPTTAEVRGDGKLISIVSPPNLRDDLNATPFIRPLPTHDAELQFHNLSYAIYTFEDTDEDEFTWFEYTLLDRIVNGTGIRSLEDSLTWISTLSYALLVHTWRTQIEAAGGGADALKEFNTTWVPANVTLHGTQPKLYARIKVEGTQLFITFASTLVLFVVTLVSTHGHAWAHVDEAVRDGGVIDIMSLMADSSLPAVIGEGAEDAAGRRDGRRVRAERTLVSYSIAALDIPEQLQRRINSMNSATTATTKGSTEK